MQLWHTLLLQAGARLVSQPPKPVKRFDDNDQVATHRSLYKAKVCFICVAGYLSRRVRLQGTAQIGSALNAPRPEQPIATIGQKTLGKAPSRPGFS
jgi:hypothetical protein